ncbi:MAG: glutathione S-transferase family protein [Candidatus Thiodiazotropha sp. 6PLUC4]
MSNLTLIIGNKNYSSWSLRPWILLKHHHIDFQEKKVALFTQTTDEELSDYNSDYKVPILKDNELLIWDSLSILEYISEQYLENHGWPVDPQERSIARSICSEMHSSYFHVRSELPMNCRKKFNTITLSQGTSKEIERICWLWRMCRNAHKNRGEWLFGEFTIADAMFAPIAIRFYGYSIPLPAIEERYMKSVLNHPSTIEWIDASKRETEVIQSVEIDTQ